MSNTVLIQAFVAGAFVILGALITGITLLRVTDRNQRHASALEQRRAKLAKGEELVAVLSELSSWRARDDQELLTELAQLEAKLNRAYALTITYYGNEENVAGDFYSEGLKVMATLNESADEYSGSSPPVDLKTINFQYLVFQATSRNLTAWVLDEMRRVNSAS
jgi:Zn-dependent M16 (insulinase) family peptidase